MKGVNKLTNCRDKKSKKKEKKSEEGEEEEEGESKDKQEKLPHQQPNWKKIESAAKSYLGNLVHYINQVTEESMQTFLLKHSGRYNQSITHALNHFHRKTRAIHGFFP